MKPIAYSAAAAENLLLLILSGDGVRLRSYSRLSLLIQKSASLITLRPIGCLRCTERHSTRTTVAGYEEDKKGNQKETADNTPNNNACQGALGEADVIVA